MTQEEKAKRYDEVVKEIKGFFEGKQKMPNDVDKTLELLFPELKESEDEKIRKAIIRILKGETRYTSKEDTDKYVAWLEKQGEQMLNGTFVNVDDVREDFIDEVYRVLNADSTNDRANQIIDAFDNLPTITIKQDPCKHCQMTQLNCYSFPCDEKREFEQGKTALEAINEEKVDNADKVEPKFKVGDWIIGKATNNEPRQISEITDQCYKSTYGGQYGFSFEDELHLWSIKDAKAGDVLYSPKGAGVEGIFLIKGWEQVECTGKTLCSSIGYRVEEDEIVEGGLGAIWWKGVKDPFFPATKEQRDLLFQKMKEEGYVWDAEKKQLRKMEHDKSKFQILKATWYVCTCTTCTEDSRIWFNNGTAYLGSEILKYDLGFEPEEYQNYFRLWTIRDAKDGDILASKSGNKIFSYRGSLDLRGNPCAYYGIYKVHDGICFSPCAIGNSFTHEEVFPATKEQRKILFEERTAAKGVLHFNKKELKKIEDEIEIPFGAKDSELMEESYNIGDVICDKSCTTLNKDAQPNMEIVDIKNGMYICDKGSFPVSQQDEYVLVGRRIDTKLNDDSVSNELRAASFAHAEKEMLNPTFPNNEEFELAYAFEEGAKWNDAQKPTWSEKYIADVFEKVGLAKIVREQSNDALTIALQDAMIELSKVTLQPKPTAWSEEDEAMWAEISDLLWEGYKQSGSKFSWDDITNWVKPKLKSLKERVQPQNKCKKSLATADLENSLCDIQDGFSDTSYEYRILGKAIEFIRCTEPKPQWKPSEEHRWMC